MAKLNRVTVLAPAKLNLALDVVGTLPNGYHDLDMTMQAITLYEKVVLTRSNGLNLTLPGSPVAANDSNTAIKAAIAFFRYTGLLAGVDITVYKNIPVRAGMAGGSADAAAVLVGLNALYGARLSMSELSRAGGQGGRGCALCPDGRAPAGCRAWAMIYERVLIAVALSGVVMHGGVERIGEAVLEHPCQSGVLTDKTLHLTNLLLYGVRDEEAVSFLRSLAGVACVVRRSSLRIAG